MEYVLFDEESSVKEKEELWLEKVVNLLRNILSVQLEQQCFSWECLMSVEGKKLWHMIQKSFTYKPFEFSI